MTSPRRFSQAISEGDGISLVAAVSSAEDAGRVETQGADAVLVSAAEVSNAEAIRAATSLPLIAQWAGDPPAGLAGIDACILPVDAEREWLDQVHAKLRGQLEIAFWVEHEEEIASALEDFDPEIFMLAAPESDGEEALEHVLDLLADVPAGKLAIAELTGSTREDIAALERAGIDGVVVEPASVAELAAAPPPEV